MRHKGKLHKWNDEKGYGFVNVDGLSKIFVHISAFERPARRPREDDDIAFDVETDSNKRLQASRIELLGVKRRSSVVRAGRDSSQRRKRPVTLPVAPMAFLMLLAVAAWLLPDLRTVTAAIGALNLVTFLMYWKDKSAAKKQHPRIPEAHLHLAALLGGWPAAWMAQHIFRHKTVKTPFRMLFWLTIIFNIAGLLFLLRHFSYL